MTGFGEIVMVPVYCFAGVHPLFVVVTVYSNSEELVILLRGVPEIVSIPLELLTSKPGGRVADVTPSTFQPRETPTAPPE